MLLAVSVVAVALAVFFAALAWRLKRQEEWRSAARVAALSDAIDGATPREASSVEVPPRFLSHEASPGGHRGLFKLAAGFAMAVVVIIAIAISSTSRAPRNVASAAGADVRAPALELVSMRHEREGNTLTVTGLVRNSGSSGADRLIAVVFAFDRNGNYIASGRAPLDFVTIPPGDESPFRVSVSNVSDVARYRVSFRNEAGLVRHVDRRAGAGNAAAQPQPMVLTRHDE